MNTSGIRLSAKPSLDRFSHLALGNLALALAYVATARLGLRFALVQGSVSLVWPASGLALAALTLWGSRLLPGVMIGAFLANFTPGHSWLFPLATTVGNSAEALVGGHAVAEARFPANSGSGARCSEPFSASCAGRGYDCRDCRDCGAWRRRFHCGWPPMDAFGSTGYWATLSA